MRTTEQYERMLAELREEYLHAPEEKKTSIGLRGRALRAAYEIHIGKRVDRSRSFKAHLTAINQGKEVNLG